MKIFYLTCEHLQFKMAFKLKIIFQEGAKMEALDAYRSHRSCY
jgi:hypothetical protein